MPERLQTFRAELVGGQINSVQPIQQGVDFPGSLLESTNHEPDISVGGYRRVSGYTKYDDAVVPGIGEVLGAFPFRNGVLAARGVDVFFGAGSGWGTRLNSADFTGATKYRAHRYNWGEDVIIFVNGANDACHYDGITLTELAGGNFPANPVAVGTFKQQLCFAGNGTDKNVLFIGSPGQDVMWTSHTEINIGYEISNLTVFRDSLYIMGPDSIHKLTGNNAQDFEVQVITTDLGCVAPDSVQEIGGDVLFLSNDGIRTIAGTERIGDVNLENLSNNVFKMIDNLDFEGSNISSVSVREKNQYRVFCGDVGVSVTDATGVLGGVRANATGTTTSSDWEWFGLTGIRVAASDSAYIEQQNGEVIVHGDYDGFVYQQEVGTSFDGRDIDASIHLPFWSYDDPAIRKTLYKLKLFIVTEGPVTLTITNVFDYLEDTTIQPPSFAVTTDTDGFPRYDEITAVYDGASIVYAGSGNVISDFNLIGSGFNNAFVFASKGTDASYTIQTLVVSYSLGGRI